MSWFDVLVPVCACHPHGSPACAACPHLCSIQLDLKCYCTRCLDLLLNIVKHVCFYLCAQASAHAGTPGPLAGLHLSIRTGMCAHQLAHKPSFVKPVIGFWQSSPTHALTLKPSSSARAAGNLRKVGDRLRSVSQRSDHSSSFSISTPASGPGTMHGNALQPIMATAANSRRTSYGTYTQPPSPVARSALESE